jgi:hypothetical protein
MHLLIHQTSPQTNLRSQYFPIKPSQSRVQRQQQLIQNYLKHLLANTTDYVDPSLPCTRARCAAVH